MSNFLQKHCMLNILLIFGITLLPSTKRFIGNPPSASISIVNVCWEFFLYLNLWIVFLICFPCVSVSMIGMFTSCFKFFSLLEETPFFVAIDIMILERKEIEPLGMWSILLRLLTVIPSKTYFFDNWIFCLFGEISFAKKGLPSP